MNNKNKILSKIRKFLQVAEIATEDKKELVGMIRGCIKTVTCGSKTLDVTTKPLYTKLAYVLGLRVSPTHRFVYNFIYARN